MSTRPGSSSALNALNRPGWLTFAAIVMFAFGCLRLISAIYYFADSVRVNNLTLGAFGGHLFLWGIWDLVIAGLAFWAAWSLLGGYVFGRVIGYLWAGFVIVQSFLILAYAPWFGFASMILATLVIYALSLTSGWEDARASTA
jgi:hypothetical protein